MKTIFDPGYTWRAPVGNDSKISRTVKILCIGVGVVLFIYCALRAYFVGITHDEAFTFEYYIRGNFKDIITQIHTSLGNHMLNSIFTKLSYLLFGSHVFFLRLPSLIFFGVFMVYTFRLLKSTVSSFLIFPSFVIIVSNPYLLDFFSLSRGYAGSYACMMGALYYTSEFVNGSNVTNKNLWRIGVWSSLTILFHYGMLNFFFPFVSLFMGWLVLKTAFSPESNKSVIRRFLSITWRPVLVYGIVLSYAIPLVIYFKHRGDLDIWIGENKYLHDSLASLVSMASYLKYPAFTYANWSEYSWLAISCLLFLWGVIILLVVFFKDKIKYAPMAVFTWLLILFVASCLLLQNILLKSAFPIERYILFAWPLLMLLFVYLFDWFYSWQRVFIIAPFIVALLFIVHFGYSANLQYTIDWSYDSKVKEVINKLEEIHKQHPSEDVDVGCTWKMEPIMNYYRFYKKLYWLRSFHREAFNTRQHFFYVFEYEKGSLPATNLSVVYFDTFTKATLFENKEVNTSPPLFESDLDTNTFNSSYNGKHCLITREWPKVIIPMKNLTSNTEYIVEACLTAHFDNTRKGFGIISLIIDDEKNGVANMWKQLDFSVAVINGDKDWQNIYYTTYLPANTLNQDNLCALVDNFSSRELCISGLKLKVWKK